MIGSSPIAWLAITGSDYVAAPPPTFIAGWARGCNAIIGDVQAMKKNVAGQKIGAQMCSATDGSAFTGAVTIYICGDAGAQAVGSVGAGACTHEGNGYHTYAPAQAETNYDLVGCTFIGSGAIPATVQVFTTFPQTGDSFALIGTAGAGLTAIDLPDQSFNLTGNITGNLSGSVGSVTGNVGGTVATVTTLTNLPAITANWLTAAGTAADFTTEIQAGLATAAALAVVDGIVDDILLDTAEIGAAGAGLTNINLPDQTMNITGNITGNLSGSVGSVTGLTTSTIADKILARTISGGADGGRTVTSTLRAIRNKVAISGGTMTVYEEDDTTTAYTAAVTTAAGDPISSIDPT